MGELNETQRYFVEEHVEDFRDGRITRRELMRRVTLIAGSAAAAVTILAACDLSPRSGAGGIATATPGTTVGGGATPTATAALVAAGPFATPPASSTTDGLTVKPDDPRISVSKPEVKGADGAGLLAYMAKPNLSGRVAGVVVVHENRGQTEHIRDVVRRVATAGFVGLNIDLAARDGGADKLTDGAAYNAALGKRSTADKLSDHSAAARSGTSSSAASTSRRGSPSTARSHRTSPTSRRRRPPSRPCTPSSTRASPGPRRRWKSS